jgi:hypothetical protein
MSRWFEGIVCRWLARRAFATLSTFAHSHQLTVPQHDACVAVLDILRVKMSKEQ